jgi:ribosomal protein L25 (general stress protein Ctc)
MATKSKSKSGTQRHSPMVPARCYAAKLENELHKISGKSYRKYLNAFGTPTEKTYLRIHRIISTANRKMVKIKAA